MKINEIMLKIENVSKIYRLGEIGGTTLKDELQRLSAKIRRKPDPTKKVGVKDYNKGEKFKALDCVSFEVKKGERIGIIGHNGAGKSTLLKLISRVTGPSDGNIYLNGRVASMLEVGTGFHPELTGRENIYMNGAILGMTKKEIDAKIEDIIDFSEVRQFIDTPVKRYSSGMYVKLAFSVAAHLDSEIMIMDEVLAVGDLSFQNKCITKMRDVSQIESRTILYVSHNMSTIKNLCDRVIVLDKGKIIFDGDVDEGIKIYLKNNRNDVQKTRYELSEYPRQVLANKKVLINEVNFIETKQMLFERGDPIKANLTICSHTNESELFVKLTLKNSFGLTIGSCFSSRGFSINANENKNLSICFSTKQLGRGTYFLSASIVKKTNNYTDLIFDWIQDFCTFVIREDNKDVIDYYSTWNSEWWGDVHFDLMEIK